MKTPAFPITGSRIIAGVRAAPSINDHNARRTLDPVVVVTRIRPALPKAKTLPLKEFM